MIRPYQQTMYADTTADLNGLIGVDGQVCIILDIGIRTQYSVAASAWLPSGSPVVIRSNVTVNGMATGNTIISTLPNTSFYFYPIDIVPRAVSVTGSGTVPAITLGTNSPNYNNIATGGMLTSLTAALGTSTGTPMPANFSPPIAGGSTVYAKVGTSALGYTAYSVKFDIIGFYDNTNV